MSNYSVLNGSEVQQIHLFDLDEYRNKEQEQLLIYKFVSCAIGVLIVLSNLTVVVSSGLILKKGQQPKSTYLLLGNISLADTIVGISLIFGATMDNSKSSNVLCIFQIGMLVCPAMVSIFSVGFIAVDRYFYILHGLYYKRWFNTTRVRIGIVCIWIVGIFISSLPVVGWTGQTFKEFRCWYITVFPPALLIVVSVVVLSVIIMVCVLYMLILHSAVKTVDKIREFKETSNLSFIDKTFEELNNMNESKTTVTITVTKETLTNKEESLSTREYKTYAHEFGSKMKEKISQISHFYCKTTTVDSHPCKMKAIKTVLLVTLCFVGTWAPYYVTVIIYVNCDIKSHGYDCGPLELLTLGPLYLLGASNSLFDPLIYAWRHSGFKKTLKKMYWRYVLKMSL